MGLLWKLRDDNGKLLAQSLAYNKHLINGSYKPWIYLGQLIQKLVKWAKSKISAPSIPPFPHFPGGFAGHTCPSVSIANEQSLGAQGGDHQPHSLRTVGQLQAAGLTAALSAEIYCSEGPEDLGKSSKLSIYREPSTC